MKSGIMVCGAVAVLCAASACWGNVNEHGLYYNNPALDPQTEAVPFELTAGVTNYFLEIDTNNNQVVMHVMTFHPAGSPNPYVYGRFWSNHEDINGGTWMYNGSLTDTNPFFITHLASPDSTNDTLEIWRVVWQPPHGWAGTVYYVPRITTDDETRYLVRDGTYLNNMYWFTNAQALAHDYSGVDYTFAWTKAIPLNYDWFYFNNPNAGSPENEEVPGVSGAHFMDYSYDPSMPSYIHFLAPMGGLNFGQVRLYYEGTDNRVGENFSTANWLANVVISNGAFHGLTVGEGVEKTVDVWRVAFYPPTGCTNIYFAPEITTPLDGTTWMVRQSTNATVITNNWVINPQVFAQGDLGGQDYQFAPTQSMDRSQSVNRDWCYMNNTNLNPQTEAIPTNVLFGSFAGGNFLDVNYGRTTTAFYVMTDKPLNLVPGEWPIIETRIYWTNDVLRTGGTEYLTAGFVANLQLSTLEFHGLPSSGSHTVDLWKVEWPQPRDPGGQPYTNAITVYYSFLLKTTLNESAKWTYQTDYTWLIGRQQLPGTGSWGYNNYPIQPQFYGEQYQIDANHYDFSYLNQWHYTPPVAQPVFSNATITAGRMIAGVMSTAGQIYYLDYTTNLLSDRDWLNVMTSNGTGAMIFLTDTNLTDRFRAYRIQLK